MMTGRKGIDLEFSVDRRAVGRITLGKNAIVRAILAVGFPHRHKAAIVEGRDGGPGLITGRGGVD